MRIFNLVPISKTLANGDFLVCRFEAEPADGIVCRLTLVTSSVNGVDMVWSHHGPHGPIVRISRDARDALARQVRAEMASMAEALAAA